VNLLESIGIDEELPLILWTISWGKLYDEPHLEVHHTYTGPPHTHRRAWRESAKHDYTAGSPSGAHVGQWV
jgi:hypothetical protein